MIKPSGYDYVRLALDEYGELVEETGTVRVLVDLDDARRSETLLALARGVNDRTGKWLVFIRERDRQGRDQGLGRFGSATLADGAAVERVLGSLPYSARRAFERLNDTKNGGGQRG